MIFEHRYNGSSSVASSSDQTGMSFVPDANRTPTHFAGTLNKRIPFREAISALHDVVVSDLRAPAKDPSDYQEWLATQEEIWLAEEMEKAAKIEGRLQEVRGRINAMEVQRNKIMGPFYKAQQKYFSYLYRTDYKAWFLLDPVITVHPDELFFECFSKDESSYARLSCNYNVFGKIGEFACGTTNVDYSSELYTEFQKIRGYRDTEFKVDPSGFEIQTANEDAFNEVKIDVPDSWVRGFLQVSSAMTLPSYAFDLHPMDVHNFCFILRQKKERQGPRSIRFKLKDGEPVRAVFEPWDTEVVCRRSIYHGEDAEIRIWGRRRLLTLERLIPIAKSFRVFLTGSGMPSFYLADLGDMTFTLGLSGWTANDWSRLGNFDLMAPRMEVDADTTQRVFAGLKETWRDDADSLAKSLNVDHKVVVGALGVMTQAGRVIYDLNQQVYRVRELSRDPLPMDELRFANERELIANRILSRGAAQVRAEDSADGVRMQGVVQDGNRQFTPKLQVNSDEQLIRAECSCNFYQQNKMRMGPCEHILAARLAHQRK